MIDGSVIHSRQIHVLPVPSTRDPQPQHDASDEKAAKRLKKRYRVSFPQQLVVRPSYASIGHNFAHLRVRPSTGSFVCTQQIVRNSAKLELRFTF